MNREKDKKTNEREVEFTITDVRLASFLVSEGIKLLDVYYDDKRCVGIFFFEQDEQILEHEHGFYCGVSGVEPRKLFRSFDEIMEHPALEGKSIWFF